MATEGGVSAPAAAADPGEAARQWMARLIALEESQQRIQRENAELRNELNQARGERDEATERAQASAQAPASTRPNDTVDTRLIGRPETFDGKDENWASFALVLKAYVAAISPRMLELIKKSEDPAFDVDNALLSNEDERWSCQLYYVLAMLCKGRSQDKVELAGEGEGAALWRSLLEEYEPRYRSRTTCLMQKLLTFRFDGDVLASLERFDRAVKVYEKSSGRALDQIIKMGVVTNGLAAHPDDSLRKLADHVVLNSARVDTYDKLRRELHEVVGTKRFLGTQSGGAVDAVAKGRGRKGDGKGGGGKAGTATTDHDQVLRHMLGLRQGGPQVARVLARRREEHEATSTTAAASSSSAWSRSLPRQVQQVREVRAQGDGLQELGGELIAAAAGGETAQDPRSKQHGPERTPEQHCRTLVTVCRVSARERGRGPAIEHHAGQRRE